MTRLIQQFETTGGPSCKTYPSDSSLAKSICPLPLEVIHTETAKKQLETSTVEVNDKQILQRYTKPTPHESNDTAADTGDSWKARHPSLSVVEEDGIQKSRTDATLSDESIKNREEKALYVGHMLMARMNMKPSSSHSSDTHVPPSRKKSVVTKVDVSDNFRPMPERNSPLTSLDSNDVGVSRKKDLPETLNEGDIRTATVLKCVGGKKLGFSIVGGHDSPNGPIGIYIKNIHPSGLAAECGCIEEGRPTSFPLSIIKEIQGRPSHLRQ